MKTEALLFSFSVRIAQNGDLVLIKRAIPSKYIPKIARIVDLPQIRDVYDAMVELSKDTETAIIRICQK